ELFHPAVSGVEAGRKKIGNQMFPHDRARPTTGHRTIQKPMLATDLNSKRRSDLTRDDGEVLRDGQLTPRAFPAEPASLKIQPKWRIERTAAGRRDHEMTIVG